jgi:hypothetical protein
MPESIEKLMNTRENQKKHVSTAPCRAGDPGTKEETVEMCFICPSVVLNNICLNSGPYVWPPKDKPAPSKISRSAGVVAVEQNRSSETPGIALAKTQIRLVPTSPRLGGMATRAMIGVTAQAYRSQPSCTSQPNSCEPKSPGCTRAATPRMVRSGDSGRELSHRNAPPHETNHGATQRLPENTCLSQSGYTRWFEGSLILPTCSIEARTHSRRLMRRRSRRGKKRKLRHISKDKQATIAPGVGVGHLGHSVIPREKGTRGTGGLPPTRAPHTI